MSSEIQKRVLKQIEEDLKDEDLMTRSKATKFENEDEEFIKSNSEM